MPARSDETLTLIVAGASLDRAVVVVPELHACVTTANKTAMVAMRRVMFDTISEVVLNASRWRLPRIVRAPLSPDTIAEMSGEDEQANSNSIEPVDPTNDLEGFSVPWNRSPLERVGEYLRRRVSGQDWRDAALEGAVVLLIGSAVLDVIRITFGVDHRSFGTVIEFAAESGNYELGLLQPTLAVFVVALMRSPRMRLRLALRAVLRSVVIVFASLSLALAVLAVHSIATAEDEDYGPSLVSLLSWIVSTGAVACGNLALSRTDRTIG